MIDLRNALAIAKEAALEAGTIITKGFEEGTSFRSKGDPADRLTQVDLDAQKCIRGHLLKAFPETGFLGEEEDGSDVIGSVEARWIVDPLDGTMNFTHKLPFCGTSIGLEVEGEMVVGVIYLPMFNWIFTAAKEKGAYKNDVPIHVTNCTDMKKALLSEIYSDRESRGKEVLYPPVTAFRKFGSAITSLALVAEGALDGTVLHCKIWDVAAAQILVKEAGGKMTMYIDNEQDSRSSLTCIASAPSIHEELCAFYK